MPVHVQVVTPEGIIVDDESVRIVTVAGVAGEIGIEENHDDLLSELAVGQIRLGRPDPEAPPERLAATAGLVEVVDGRVMILVEAAERAGDIDLERAREAKERAQAYLDRSGDPDIDVARAELALARALNRLDTASPATANHS